MILFMSKFIFDCSYTHLLFTSYLLWFRIVRVWLWGHIVQLRLDEVLEHNAIHKISKQKKILLPSGARHIDIYENPEKYPHCEDQIIKIEPKEIDRYLGQYDRPDLLQFGSDEAVDLCERLYQQIGSPSLSASVGWSVFVEMVNLYVTSEAAAGNRSL